MNIDISKVARPLRWLIPGLGIKRWYALVFVGLLLASLRRVTAGRAWGSVAVQRVCL